MAKKGLNEALETVEITYGELSQIANDMVSEYFDPINSLVSDLGDINLLTNDEIRNFMINIAIRSFSLSEVKEKAALKAELAEAIRKETYARKFSEAEGTVGGRDTFATMETSQELVVQCLYDLVANLLRSKQDSCNRLVDACKTVIMSRMSEAKLTTNSID